jgi:hypothetical protein
MTCAECDDYEYRRANPLLWQIRRAARRALAPRPSPFAGIGSAWAVMLGAAGPAGPSHYERHRQAWIETGDDRELERMVRLVG